MHVSGNYWKWVIFFLHFQKEEKTEKCVGHEFEEDFVNDLLTYLLINSDSRAVKWSWHNLLPTYPTYPKREERTEGV